LLYGSHRNDCSEDGRHFAGMKAGEALRRVIVSDSWHG